MKREEQIKFCKKCNHKKMDLTKGLICNLTNEKADFTESCEDYSVNEAISSQVEQQELETKLLNNTASKEKRFLNFIIDYIVRFILITVINILLMFILVNSLLQNQLFVYLVAYVTTTLYYLLFEFYTGKTIGKLITKTIVVDENGNKPSFNSILWRTLSRLIPFDGLSFLGSSSGWHDNLSKTLVINSSKKSN